MNEADSELVAGILATNGYEVHPVPDGADVILLNTCAVREHAEQRVLGRIGQLAEYKYLRPDVIIGVLGCMSQHLKDRLLKLSRFVDIAAGPDSYRRLPELIEAAQEERVLDVRLDPSETYDGVAISRRTGVSAWVTVQRGCDKCCSFCIVPAVRGRERCVPLTDIVTEVDSLTKVGVREVNLLGQTVNSYNDGIHDFADLLEGLACLPDLYRIRFTSPYPTEFTDKIINLMAQEPKIARHVHLPLQSASDVVLTKARRRYTILEYDNVLTKLRSAIPDLAVSTDIIVGFHGEGEREFQETCSYLRRTRFDFAFMFKYSKRSQTAAWRWEETIDENTKDRRLKEVIDIQESISSEIGKAFVGKTVNVLVEGGSAKQDGKMFGRTSDFKQVVFPDCDAAAGSMVDVRVTQATGHTLQGERILSIT